MDNNKMADYISRITDDHVSEIKMIFELFDCKKNDGNITKSEMRIFLNKLGIFPSRLELDAMFDYFDSSGNGMIDFPEFLSLMTKDIDKTYLQDNTELQDAFNLFDRDQDGIIGKNELFQILCELGFKKLTLKDVERAIEEACPMNNGYIDFENFRAIVNLYFSPVADAQP